MDPCLENETTLLSLVFQIFHYLVRSSVSRQHAVVGQGDCDIAFGPHQQSCALRIRQRRKDNKQDQDDHTCDNKQAQETEMF
jgi:hypothetical protein